MRFTKAHGLGNDFLLFDLRGAIEASISPLDPSIARALCDRRFGIGADGVLGILDATCADARARMAIRNADGSEPEMCGNGIRCVAKWLYDRGMREKEISVETGAGVLRCGISVGKDGRAETITVLMGRAQLGAIAQDLDVLGNSLCFTEVSMGNPHAVHFVQDKTDLRALAERLGPIIEHLPRYPRRTNVEFAHVTGNTIDLCVWERGAGLTLACGTGACATVAAAVATQRIDSDRETEVRLPGGSLWIQVTADLQKVTMRGPAVEVFEGVTSLPRTTV